MHFGLKNGPSILQELTSVVLDGTEKYVAVFIDFILILSVRKQDHLKPIDTVFNELYKQKRNLKLAK